jgi:wyosine [tRNA(Phe)-imidazoG37] synthetase (radical SAM superfamily)
MKVSIQLDGETNSSQSNDRQTTFTSNESIKGDVQLILQRADAVSKITLSLQG